MGWSFRRVFTIFPGVRINFSKSGISISFGTRGFRWGVGPRGKRTELSIPGTGIFFRKYGSWNPLQGNAISGKLAGSVQCPRCGKKIGKSDRANRTLASLAKHLSGTPKYGGHSLPEDIAREVAENTISAALRSNQTEEDPRSRERVQNREESSQLNASVLEQLHDRVRALEQAFNAKLEPISDEQSQLLIQYNKDYEISRVRFQEKLLKLVTSAQVKANGLDKPPTGDRFTGDCFKGLMPPDSLNSTIRALAERRHHYRREHYEPQVREIPMALKQFEGIDLVPLTPRQWALCLRMVRECEKQLQSMLARFRGMLTPNQHEALTTEQKGSYARISELRRLVANSTSDADERIYAVRQLVEQKSKEAIPDLLAVLRDTDSRVRKAAIEALVQLKAAEAGRDLIRLLGDEDSDVCRAAVCGVGSLLLKDASPRLIELLHKSDNPARWDAAWALGEIKSSEAISALREVMDDESPEMRILAAERLSFMGVKEIIPKLNAWLDDPEYDIRLAAIHALRELKATSAVPKMRLLMKSDDDSQVRTTACEAIGELCEWEDAAASKPNHPRKTAQPYEFGINEEQLRRLLTLIVEWRVISGQRLLDVFESRAQVTNLLSFLEAAGLISKPEGELVWLINFEGVDSFLRNLDSFLKVKCPLCDKAFGNSLERGRSRASLTKHLAGQKSYSGHELPIDKAEWMAHREIPD